MEQIRENSSSKTSGNLIRTGILTLDDFLKVAQKGDFVEFTLYKHAVLDARQIAGPHPARFIKPELNDDKYGGFMINADGVRTGGYVYGVEREDYRNDSKHSNLGLIERVELTGCDQPPYDGIHSWYVNMDVVKSFKVFKSFAKD